MKWILKICISFAVKYKLDYQSVQTSNYATMTAENSCNVVSNVKNGILVIRKYYHIQPNKHTCPSIGTASANSV